MLLEEKIEKAVVRITADNAYLYQRGLTEKFTNIYPFTTENIKGYLENYDLKNQTVLTVGASGDHILNLILLGATQIDYFDINPFTEFYVELKIAAVKALEYEEFLQYFCADDWEKIECFNSRLYRKMSPYLKGDTRTFWDSLYLEFTGKKIRFSNLFSRDESPSRILSDINLYLEKEKYYHLKEKLLQNQYQLHFYEENLKDLPSKLKKSYDKILLSNIAQYLYIMYQYIYTPTMSYEEFYLSNYQQLIKDLSYYLNSNGVIFVAYLYGGSYNFSFAIYDAELRKKYFSPTQYQFLKFIGVRNFKYGEQRKDAVLVYKKN